jgi:hypothetical protein
VCRTAAAPGFDTAAHVALATFACGRLRHDPAGSAEAFAALWGLLGPRFRFPFLPSADMPDGALFAAGPGPGGAPTGTATDTQEALAADGVVVCDRAAIVELLGVLCLDQGVAIQALPVTGRMWGLALLLRLVQLCAEESALVAAAAAAASDSAPTAAMATTSLDGKDGEAAAESAEPAAVTLAERYGMDLAFSVLRSVDGEKDPRCLSVAFPLVEAALATIREARTRFAEEFFEVTACYFPIAFSPPPGGFPSGAGAPPAVPALITREGLAASLERALTAHPCLAQHVYPLIAEKLAADGETARGDAIALAVCTARGFGAQTVARYARSSLWPAFRDEVVHGVASGKTREAALRGLAAIAAALEREDVPVQGARVRVV